MKKYLPILSFIFLLIKLKLMLLSAFSITNIHDIISFSDKMMEISQRIKIDTNFQTDEAKSLSLHAKLYSVRKLSQQISELTEDVEIEMSSLFITVLHGIPLAGDIKSVIREFYNCVIRIEELYRLYKEITTTPPPFIFENHSVYSLIDTAMSDKYGDLTDMLYRVWRLFVPTNLSVIKRGILDYVIEQQMVSDPRIVCASYTSFQYRLNEFYSSAVASEIKGFILRSFSYGILQGAFTSELQSAQMQLIFRSNDYLEITRSAMQSVPRDIHRCDPETYTWNETYAELQFLFQKIVVNEMQVFPVETCSLDCYSINSTLIHRCYTWSAASFPTQAYCPKRYCRGRMEKCAWIGSVTLCELPSESNRRYEWIQSENGRYGSFAEECDGERVAVNLSMSGFYNCDNCLCDCIEERADSEALRTISLRPQMSNVAENKVITGIRFLLKNKVLHIQIEESNLLQHGRINTHNRSWVFIDEWVYMSNVSRGGFYMIKDDEQIDLQNEVDYSFIRSDQRIMHLDLITAPYDHLITGVRFNHVWPPWPDESNDSPLHIEIFVTPYNYDDGKLDIVHNDLSHWVTPQTLYNPSHHYYRERTEVKIPRPTSPIQSSFNVPDSVPNQFIRFRSSDIWKDAGQSTIPFFDLQPINSLREALDCLGIFHRGAKGFGGFIALQICTLDISRHLTPLTEEEVEMYKSANNDRTYTTGVKHRVV